MPVSIDLSEKIALVTMSTSGIGLSIAKKVAAAGAKVVIVNGRDAERGARACRALREIAPGTEAVFLKADIREREQISEMFGTVAARYGGLDCYVGIGTVVHGLDPFVAIDPAH